MQSSVSVLYAIRIYIVSRPMFHWRNYYYAELRPDIKICTFLLINTHWYTFCAYKILFWAQVNWIAVFIVSLWCAWETIVQHINLEYLENNILSASEFCLDQFDSEIFVLIRKRQNHWCNCQRVMNRKGRSRWCNLKFTIHYVDWKVHIISPLLAFHLSQIAINR